MVGIPANTAGYMERYLGIEAKERGDLIGYDFCRMVVSVIHERKATVMCCGKRKREFSASRRIRLNTDTEYFRFNAGLYKIFVKRL